ncbi:hypothetical protein FTUN_7721 [Frigoriglobus tundricola]|uniref:Uncharacterized protein n=1 Tax=Frigoriglobus tundricola TaxID=2774151 RepID=A0A6M5Z2Y7_9BACT|nr:hypothetical protein FTUN_7721 [Frigoriglobus tundricola]
MAAMRTGAGRAGAGRVRAPGGCCGSITEPSVAVREKWLARERPGRVRPRDRIAVPTDAPSATAGNPVRAAAQPGAAPGSAQYYCGSERAAK